MKMPYAATQAEYLRRKRRAELPGTSPMRGAWQPRVENDVPTAVHPGLDPDPVGTLAGQEEAFFDGQLSEGQRISAAGVGPQTAGEQINMQLAQEYERVPLAPEPQTIAPSAAPASKRVAPHNDPMSTVPGGPFGPAKTPGG